MMNDNIKSRRGLWLFAFTLIFALGFTLGAVAQKNDRINDIISGYTAALLDSRLSNDVLTVFIDSALPYFAILVLMCFFGTGRIGAFLNACIVLCAGMGNGALIANLACDSWIRGLGFSVIVLLPGMITAACAILLFVSRLTDLSTAKDCKRWFCHRQKFLTLLIYIFVIIFSAGLDVTFSELYKTLSPA